MLDNCTFYYNNIWFKNRRTINNENTYLKQLQLMCIVQYTIYHKVDSYNWIRNKQIFTFYIIEVDKNDCLQKSSVHWIALPIPPSSYYDTFMKYMILYKHVFILILKSLPHTNDRCNDFNFHHGCYTYISYTIMQYNKVYRKR